MIRDLKFAWRSLSRARGLSITVILTLALGIGASPHHLSATMVTGREHRMTEIFGRLAPGASLETARAELQAIHKAATLEVVQALRSE